MLVLLQDGNKLATLQNAEYNFLKGSKISACWHTPRDTVLDGEFQLLKYRTEIPHLPCSHALSLGYPSSTWDFRVGPLHGCITPYKSESCHRH